MASKLHWGNLRFSLKVKFLPVEEDVSTADDASPKTMKQSGHSSNVRYRKNPDRMLMMSVTRMTRNCRMENERPNQSAAVKPHPAVPAIKSMEPLEISSSAVEFFSE